MLFFSCSFAPEPYFIGIPDEEWFKGAVELALEEINSRGGIGGRPLQAVYAGGRKGQSPIEAAVTIADRLSADPNVVAVIGHYGSASSLPASHIYNRRGVVNIVPDGTNPLLAGVGPWIFRMSVSDTAQGRYLAGVAYEKLGFRRPAVLFANNDYGKLLARAFMDRFSELGGEICYIGWFDTGDHEVPELLVARARASGCEEIFFVGTFFDLSNFLEEMRSQDFEAAVLAGDGCFSVSGVEEISGLSGGNQVFVSTFYNPASEDPAVARFREAFNSRNKSEPQTFDALVYDSVYLLADAIRHAGGTREAVRDYLSRVGRAYPAFRGVSGTIVFYENGENRRPVSVLSYDASLRLVATEVISPSARDGREQ